MYYLPILQINTKPLDGGIITFKLYIFFYSEHIPLLHYIISNKLKPEFKAAFYHEFSWIYENQFLEPWEPCCGECTATLENSPVVPQKVNFHSTQIFHQAIGRKETTTHPFKNLCTIVAALFTVAKKWKPESPCVGGWMNYGMSINRSIKFRHKRNGALTQCNNMGEPWKCTKATRHLYTLPDSS